MKLVSERLVAWLCVVTCAAVAAVEVWPSAQLVRTSDENGDGRPDVWRRYDYRGQLTEVDVDSNFDGRPDVTEYYERGALVRRESDRNFNGQADLVEEFDAQTHQQTRSVVDLDYDGTADLLVLFRDGQPIFSKRTCSRGCLGRPGPSRPASPSRGASSLVGLADPFESDPAFRALGTVPDCDGCAALSTSRGLPARRIAAGRGTSPSARLGARDVQPDALTHLLPGSPRAPPVSHVPFPLPKDRVAA
jgi:hypothetical protein